MARTKVASPAGMDTAVEVVVLVFFGSVVAMTLAAVLGWFIRQRHGDRYA